MAKYKIEYNYHKNTDASGSIKVKTLKFECSSISPEEYLEQWRFNDEGFNRPHIGMIHWETLKKIC